MEALTCPILKNVYPLNWRWKNEDVNQRHKLTEHSYQQIMSQKFLDPTTFLDPLILQPHIRNQSFLTLPSRCSYKCLSPYFGGGASNKQWLHLANHNLFRRNIIDVYTVSDKENLVIKQNLPIMSNNFSNSLLFSR